MSQTPARPPRALASLALLAVLALIPSPAAAGPPPAPAAPAATPTPKVVDLSRFFEGVPGTFVLVDGRTGAVSRYAPERAAIRFTPASTFKVPNAVIFLETGVADGADFALPYDPVRDPKQGWWPSPWAKDQTLRTAMKESVVWYFQELARRVGPERMRTWLDRLGYGNREMGKTVDRFWLDGSLLISPDEEADFMRRLHEGRLGASARTTAIVKEILVLDTRDGVVLRGKTGTPASKDGRQMSWLVGTVERPDGAFHWALNVDAPSAKAWSREKRVEKARAILVSLGVLPSSWLGTK